jgi:hypothetical protein
MPLGEFLAGLAFFLAMVVAAGVTAAIVTRRRLGHLSGIQRALAVALWFTLAVLAAHLIPLALGILSRGTVVGAALGTAACVAALVRPRADRLDPPPPAAAPSGRIALLIGAAATAAVATYELAALRVDAVSPFTHIDVLSFHLPGVARWIQTGSLWQIDQLFPYNVTGNYPNSGDVLTLATVLPWHDLAFARFVQLPFLALTWLAIFALARELGARAATAALAASLVASLPATSIYVADGLPDVILLFGFSTGLLFLTRHRRTARRSDLVLAGLGLGLALGTKWYGLTIDVAAVAVWAAVTLAERRRLRPLLGDAALLGAVALAVGGIWLVRNLVESGNPIFPQRIGIGGVTLFAGTHNAAVDRAGYTVLHYATRPTVLREFVVPGLRAQLGLGGAVLGASSLAIVAGAAIGRPRRRRRGDAGADGTWVTALAALALLLAIVWALTPGSAPGREGQPQVLITVRWLVPAPLVAAAALAGAAGTLRRPVLVLAIDVLLGIAIGDALRRDPALPATALAEAAFALALIVAAAALAVDLRAREAFRAHAGAHLAVAVACPVLILLAVAARIDQVHFDRHTYAPFDPTFAWIDRHAPPGTRVGLAGEASLRGLSPILPAFGPRLGNRVEYVGPWAGNLLREYRRRRPFVRAVERGRYQLLLVGRGIVPHRDSPPQRWARAAGYREVAASHRLALFERRPGPSPPR